MLALVLAAVALVPDPAPADVVTLRVLRGRAWIVEADGELATQRPSHGSSSFTGPLRIELTVASVLVLAQPGAWSLRLEGPAIVTFEPPAAVEEGAEPPPPLLALHDLGAGELEVRTGSLRVAALEHGWELVASRSAFRLEGRPAGALRVLHHGGRSIRVKSLAPRRPGTWPASVVAGGRADLPPPQSGEADSPSPWM